MKKVVTADTAKAVIIEIARGDKPETMQENLRDLIDLFLTVDEEWDPQYKDSVFHTFQILDQALFNIAALVEANRRVSPAM